LAEIDSNLREGERAWKAVVRKLDASRQELAVAAVQLQMTRSLASRQSRKEDGESDGRKRPDLALGEEAHYARLLQQFEAGLTEAEMRRVSESQIVTCSGCMRLLHDPGRVERDFMPPTLPPVSKAPS